MARPRNVGLRRFAANPTHGKAERMQRATGCKLSRGRWRGTAAVALAVAVILVSGRSGAGHSVGHFPSYYPDEIRIDVVDPEAAARGLANQTLHAYVGAA